MNETPAPKRQYLRADDRRLAILMAADELVAREGLGQLNIVGVAAQAGISRQLIYRHFSDRNDLLLALVEYRFSAIEQGFDEHLSTSGGDPRRLVESRIRSALDLPVRDQHLVRSVFSGIDQLQPDLAQSISLLRHRLIDRWIRIKSPDRINDPALQASIWSIFHALFGLWDFTQSGAIDRESALEILMRYADALLDLVREDTATRHTAPSSWAGSASRAMR